MQKLLSQSQKLQCQIKGHEKQEIKKLCFSADCKQQRMMCSECAQRHQNHKDCCLPIVEVNQLIHQGIISYKSQVKNLQSEIQMISKKFQSNIIENLGIIQKIIEWKTKYLISDSQIVRLEQDYMLNEKLTVIDIDNFIKFLIPYVQQDKQGKFSMKTAQSYLESQRDWLGDQIQLIEQNFLQNLEKLKQKIYDEQPIITQQNDQRPTSQSTIVAPKKIVPPIERKVFDLQIIQPQQQKKQTQLLDKEIKPKPPAQKQPPPPPPPPPPPNLIQLQIQLNKSLQNLEEQDISKQDLNDNQIKHLMFEDFKRILIQAYQFQPYESQNSIYTKYYTNQLFISINQSNNLYYELNKKQYNISQHQEDLLNLWKELKAKGQQFKNLIKNILDRYVAFHLLGKEFKRELCELVPIPMQEADQIQFDKVELIEQQKLEVEVTVDKDKPISEIDYESFSNLLFIIRKKSLQKVRNVKEDELYSLMKEECQKLISKDEQNDLLFFLQAIKQDSQENEQFCNQAKKYYKPIYKPFIEMFLKNECEKFQAAFRILLKKE